ncbi:MAG: nucleotidyltransferase domain-containing protein [Cyanobacteria bacterium J06623_4]
MTSQVAFFPTVLRDRLNTNCSRVESFCKRWNIKEIAFFGSVIRDDFTRSSDIEKSL